MNATDVLDLGILRLESIFSNDFTVSLLAQEEVQDSNSVNGSLKMAGFEHKYQAITHRGIAPLRNLTAHWSQRKEEAPLFFVPTLDAKERSACRKEGIQFVDTQGNCYLDLPGCHVYVSKDETAPTRLSPTGKAFQANGLRFIMAIYNEPELLNKTYREIAEKTSVSTGSLSGIFEDLRANEFLRKDEETGFFSIINELELVKRFAYTYLVDVRPKLLRGTFYMAANDTLERVSNTIAGDQILVGGQHAANVRGDYLVSSVFNLYTDVRIGDLAKNYRLIPVGNTIDYNRITVEVFNIFGGRYGSGQSEGVPLVNDLLIYADLLNSHDVRVLDAAERLLTNEIFNKFSKNWLRYGRPSGVLSTS